MSIALRLALHLPRDAATVPVVRRLLDQALRTLGVEPSCRDDISLILTEACANVIEHALQIDDYEITIDVTSARCMIHVINAGAVVDPSRLSPSAAAPVPGDADFPSVPSSARGGDEVDLSVDSDGPRGDLVFDPVLDEHGRGLHIIRSLADELYLTPSLSGGLVLQAVTTLRWTAEADVWQRH
ncbi:ATP-binding protein [Dactylosporangium sp. NPDC049140]|uniref:ATP-binding protein n=1 Tax=Dactylosporangium sp. NPDC049140 TaxID=3155647 RepID=UPI0033D1CAFB